MHFGSGYGGRLRDERKRLGLTQDDMKAVADVSRRTQNAYEAEKSSPPLSYFSAIEKAGFDAFFIITGTMPDSRLTPVETMFVKGLRQLETERREMLLTTARLVAPNVFDSGTNGAGNASIHDRSVEYRGESKK